MEITFVTDYVCPFCIVGKELLERAIDRLGLDVQVTHHPIELTEEPEPRVDTYHDEKRRERYKKLVEPGKALGLDLKIPPNIIPRPYSRLAHEGWFYAKEHGAGKLYSDLVYKAYFIDEEDIGELSVLADIAGKAGLNADEFRQALEEGTYKKVQRDAVKYAKEELKVTSLPTLVINGKKINFQEYTIDEAVRILQNGEHTTSKAGESCSIDGCCS